MSEGLGFGKRKLISEIVKTNWDTDKPEKKNFTYNELLFVIQEMLDEEGKAYLQGSSRATGRMGFHIFRNFVELLLYRNLANYDSMILVTAEKGTGKSSAAMMLARAWCNLIGIKFNPQRHIAYNNGDVMRKIDTLEAFEPIICVSQNTKIKIRDEKNIERSIEIKKLVNKKDYEVLTYNKELDIFEYQKPKETVMTKKAVTWKVELDNGIKITATPEHLFLTKNRGYIQLKDLDKNDKLITYLKNKQTNNIKSITVKIKKITKNSINIPVYDIIGLPNHNFVANNIVVHNCDEAVRFAASADWAKKEHKALRRRLAEVRTKHLLFILCFPLKIQKVEKNYLESFANYWIDLFDRGKGAIYVKDKNPMQDSWRIKDFSKVGSYTEFTRLSKIEAMLKKHPNFWQIIKFPKPPKWLYNRYLKVREKNVYDDDSVMANVSKEDIHNALLVLALRDIMMNDTTFTMNRIILHVKNHYDINITKSMVQHAINDATQLVTKIREELSEKIHNESNK